HERAVVREAAVADGVNAAVDAMQRAGLDALTRGLIADSEILELRGADDSVLALGELGQLRIKGEAGGCVTFLRLCLSHVTHPRDAGTRTLTSLPLPAPFLNQDQRIRAPGMP